MHAKQKAVLSASTVIAFMLLLLFNVIPGLSASAATKNYSVAFSGGKVSYYNSSAISVKSNPNVSVSCSSRGSFNLTISPNTSASPRTISLTSTKSGGGVLDTIIIKQSGVPTKTLNVGCTGGKLSFTPSGAYSYSYSNAAVCNSRSGSSFVVKPNSTTVKRSCTVTVRNSANRVIYYVYINQDAVPVKPVSVAGNTTSFSYGKTGAVTLTPGSRTMIPTITASNPGSFTLFVAANPSNAKARSTDVVVRNASGAYLEIIRVTQAKFSAPKYNYEYNSDPRTLTFTCANANASKTVVSNPGMASCASLGGGKFQVKLTQNPNNSARSCEITFRDSCGTALAKYTLRQKGVPLRTQSVAGNATSFPYGKSGAVTLTPGNRNMIPTITASNPGSFTLSVSANPSAVQTRSTDVIVKNASGVYLEIIRVTQAKFEAPKYNYEYNSDPRTLTYTFQNADASKTSVSGTAMASCTAQGGGKFQVKLTQNPSVDARSCKIVFKDKFNTVIAELNLKQKGVPMSTQSVPGSGGSFSYGKTGAISLHPADRTMIPQISASNPGSFNVSVPANPSSTPRSTDMIVKGANDVYLEIVRVTQAKFQPPTRNRTIDSKRTVVKYFNRDADHFNFSNDSMCSCALTSGNGQFEFVVRANRSGERKEYITVYDKYNTIIEKLCIVQSEEVSYLIGAGAGENITYFNPNAVSFVLPENVKSARSTSEGYYIFNQAANKEASQLSGDIAVKDSKNNVIQYIEMISTPNITRIKRDFEGDIPNAGMRFTATFETTNPVTVTLTNAKFADGTKSKTIRKNALEPNSFKTSGYQIIVDALDGTANREVKITASNGVTTETMTLTQLGQQLGFGPATAKDPLGTLGRGHYIYSLRPEAESGWETVGDPVHRTELGVDMLAVLACALEGEEDGNYGGLKGILNFALPNLGNWLTALPDCTFVNATFYKDQNDNRYAVITGNDSDTQRLFLNTPEVVRSGRPYNYSEDGHYYSVFIDEDHSIYHNWLFWVDTEGTVKMSLRKMAHDSITRDGTEIGILYNIGYNPPRESADTQIELPDPNAYHSFVSLPITEPKFYYEWCNPYSDSVASSPYPVSEKYQSLLNQLY